MHNKLLYYHRNNTSSITTALVRTPKGNIQDHVKDR